MKQRVNFSFKATILVMVAAATFSSGIISPCLSIITRHFNAESSMPGKIVSIYLLGYLLGQLLYPAVIQKIGYKKCLQFGFFIFLISNLIQIISIYYHLINLFLYGRFLCALGASSGLICAFALINECAETKDIAQKLIASAFISLTLFSYLSITLGGLVSEFWGWKTIIYLLIGFSFTNLLLISKYITHYQLPVIHSKAPTLRKLVLQNIKSIFNLKLTSASFIVAFTTTSTYTYTAFGSILATDTFKLSPKIFGVISAINLLGLLLGGWSSAFFSKKYQPSFILSIGVLVCSIPISVLLLYYNIAFSSESKGILFFPLVFLLNLGIGLVYPSASYIALNTIDNSAEASSIMNFFKIGCPAFIIYLASRSDYSTEYNYSISLLIVFLIAVTSLIYLHKTYK